MKARFALFLVVLLSVTPVYALTVVSKVTPEWTREMGITVKSEKRPDGAVSFTVTRYLDTSLKLSEQGGWKLERLASLEVRNQAGVLATTNVAAEVNKDAAVYVFTLSRDCIAQSHFSISEYYARDGVGLPGSRVYEIDLVACASPAKPLYHP